MLGASWSAREAEVLGFDGPQLALGAGLALGVEDRVHERAELEQVPWGVLLAPLDQRAGGLGDRLEHRGFLARALEGLEQALEAEVAYRELAPG